MTSLTKNQLKLGALVAGGVLIVLGLFLNKLIIIAGGAFIVFALILHFRKSEWEVEVRNSLDGMGIQRAYVEPRTFRVVTPLGAIGESVVPVPAEALAALDRGFQRQIDRFAEMWRRAGFPAWPDEVRGTRFMFIHPNRLMAVGGGTEVYPVCELESIPGAPCFYANGIKTAGTVLGMDDRWDAIDKDPVIVLPHQGGGNWQWLDYLAAAAHNEREHYAGWKFRRTQPTGFFYQFIGTNDQHPQQYDANNPVPYEEMKALLGRPAVMDAIPHNCFPEVKR